MRTGMFQEVSFEGISLPHLRALLDITHTYMHTYIHTYKHTGCPRRNGQNFGRVFLMLKYTDITQNNYIQS